MASLLARFIQHQYQYQYFIFESPGLYKVHAWILSQELREKGGSKQMKTSVAVIVSQSMDIQ